MERTSADPARNAFVLMHSPAWMTAGGIDRDPGDFADLLLNGTLDKGGPVEGDHTVEFGMYRPEPKAERRHRTRRRGFNRPGQ